MIPSPAGIVRRNRYCRENRCAKWFILLTAVSAFTIAGCSHNNPIGPEQGAHLLSVHVKVLEAPEDTESPFTVEAPEDCADQISKGDTISVTVETGTISEILRGYQENNSFQIYFPTIDETMEGFSVTCFDVVQYDPDGEVIRLHEGESSVFENFQVDTQLVPYGEDIDIYYVSDEGALGCETLYLESDANDVFAEWGEMNGVGTVDNSETTYHGDPDDPDTAVVHKPGDYFILYMTLSLEFAAYAEDANGALLPETLKKTFHGFGPTDHDEVHLSVAGG